MNRKKIVYVIMTLIIVLVAVFLVQGMTFESHSLEGWQKGHFARLLIREETTDIDFKLSQEETDQMPQTLEAKVIYKDNIVATVQLENWETNEYDGSFRGEFKSSVFYASSFYKKIDTSKIRVNFIYDNQPHVLQLEPSFEEVYGDK